MNKFSNVLAKSDKNGNISLYAHLKLVEKAAYQFANHFHLNPDLVCAGAVFHDIGKTHPIFQKRLGKVYNPTWDPFRHEIASLLFLPMIESQNRNFIVEMIVAHHKSTIGDVRELGIIDLYERFECEGGELFEQYFQGFSEWSPAAFSLLGEFGFVNNIFVAGESEMCFYEAIDYCKKISCGWSEWKAVLMASDYFASAFDSKTDEILKVLFKIPDLSFYNRKNELYPLSLRSASSPKKHTLVSAPTGAGKTDFLLRRCNKRIFYILPFQASINAMYKRLKDDLYETDADIRLLHSTSEIITCNGKKEERILQGLIGASIKVLTPHQLASIVFGTHGYEMLLLDIQESDIILDEIHTYTTVSQAIVLEIVKILSAIGCCIHIGTATMPTSLKEQILKILGKDVKQVELEPKTLESFNRHIVYKIDTIESEMNLIKQAIQKKEKILIVANQIKRALAIYDYIIETFPTIKKMLIHSRFKRADRAVLENVLKVNFDNQCGPSIVVSTQVVEVSLDISFDLMITECAPIDSLVQRFGRINRRRTTQSVGKLKPIYVCKPPKVELEAMPYDLETLEKSYDVLPNGSALLECNVQRLLDIVYPKIDTTSIASHVIFKNGSWLLKKLVHRPKSVLMELLDIDSAVCICQSDEHDYTVGSRESRISVEIPVSYKSIAFRELRQSAYGSKPYVLPDSAYNAELGIDLDYASPIYYTDNFI